MRVQTKKLTTAAVCTAIAIIMCVCTAYLPFSFMPLYIAAFSIFLACKRGSLVYGVLSAAATVGIMFAMTGLSVSWFLLLFMFAPYGIVTYFLHRLSYFKPKSGIIRGVIAVAFFNLTTALTYIVATRVVSVGIDIPVTDWVNLLGGYWVFAVVATLVLVPLDFIFWAMGGAVLKRIPPAEVRKRIEKSHDAGPKTTPEADSEQPEYDIFGYEITDKKTGDESSPPRPDSSDNNREDDNKKE